jgi:hypothetical protein
MNSLRFMERDPEFFPAEGLLCGLQTGPSAIE